MAEDDLVECPVCWAFVLSSQLEQHVNAHFDQQEEGDWVACTLCGARVALGDLVSHEEAHRQQQAEDAEAQLYQRQRQQARDVEEQEFGKLRAQHGFADAQRPGRCYTCGEEGHWSVECPRNPGAARRRTDPLPINPAELVARHTPQPEDADGVGDVIPLLEACLRASSQAAAQGHNAYLCGPVCHFSSGREDSGWGCGYRNLQMQVSHVFAARPEAAPVLFGGCGFVPDVASLQAWLEAAWARGFDPEGAEQLGGGVQGTRKWIGTTEAAALLRSFGLRALVVDFHG